MHARIVELYALSYPYRSRTQNEYRLFITVDVLQSLVLLVVGSVEIRRLRVEFRGASIDHFVYRIAVNGNLMSAYPFYCFVGVTVALTLEIAFFVNFFALYFLLVIDKVFELVEEESVYTRYLEYPVQGDTFLDCAEYGEQP